MNKLVSFAVLLIATTNAIKLTQDKVEEDTIVDTMPVEDDLPVSIMPVKEEEDLPVSIMPVDEEEDLPVSTMPVEDDLPVSTMPVEDDLPVSTMPVVDDEEEPIEDWYPENPDYTVIPEEPEMPIIDPIPDSDSDDEDIIVDTMPVEEEEDECCGHFLTSCCDENADKYEEF